MLQQIDFSLSPLIHEWQNLLIHVDLVAKKEWIEREKVEFPFKKRRGEGNKGKGKKENQFVGTNFFP